jgi:hypothetical protein
MRQNIIRILQSCFLQLIDHGFSTMFVNVQGKHQLQLYESVCKHERKMIIQYFLVSYRWTIFLYFAKFLRTQFDNKCDPRQSSPRDWRCMIGGFENPRPSVKLQVSAFASFVSSGYSFSHFEWPLKATQVFVANVHAVTVVRHPVERVISSFNMMKEQMCSDNCTLQAWINRNCLMKVKPGHVLSAISTLSGSLTTGELDRNYMTRWLSGEKK